MIFPKVNFEGNHMTYEDIPEDFKQAVIDALAHLNTKMDSLAAGFKELARKVNGDYETSRNDPGYMGAQYETERARFLTDQK